MFRREVNKIRLRQGVGVGENSQLELLGLLLLSQLFLPLLHQSLLLGLHIIQRHQTWCTNDNTTVKKNNSVQHDFMSTVFNFLLV